MNPNKVEKIQGTISPETPKISFPENIADRNLATFCIRAYTASGFRQPINPNSASNTQFRANYAEQLRTVAARQLSPQIDPSAPLFIGYQYPEIGQDDSVIGILNVEQEDEQLTPVVYIEDQNGKGCMRLLLPNEGEMPDIINSVGDRASASVVEGRMLDLVNLALNTANNQQ